MHFLRPTAARRRQLLLTTSDDDRTKTTKVGVALVLHQNGLNVQAKRTE